ncbi:MAG: hypothetical protein KGL39_05510 [Patescibacteria group bacterium]|nr:hypothetical protein [Patescibacteria group bacterium]
MSWTLQQWLAALNTGGLPFLIVLIGYGGLKRWWVFGWQYDELEQRFRRLSERSEQMMDIALTQVERMIRIGREANK